MKKNILKRDDEFKKYKTLKEKRISENAKLNRTRAPIQVFRTSAECNDVLSAKHDQWKKNKLKADKRSAKGPRNLGIPKATRSRKKQNLGYAAS